MLDVVAPRSEDTRFDKNLIAAAKGTDLIIHVLVLIAIPFCGNVYWRLERTRRAQEIEADLVEQQLTDNFETTSVGGDA